MNDTIYETASFFYKQKRSVHVVKHDGRFSNGVISEVDKDKLILNDERLGLMPIFFSDIKFLEPRSEQ